MQIEVEKSIGETDFSDLTLERQYQAIKAAVEKINQGLKYVETGLPDFGGFDLGQQTDSLTENQNQDGN